ncbi:leucine-rich repeat-containing protein let-4-like [Harmonia axyridis]|uniref:leucine-rich repeat-containing protein let-4-like n=1 Tax=Harmonia axyridis TaxID=115357 RepID=UPI001E276C66|nr:leucine-rich repeat-containing protein let-4-like [Harmonia axyridis]XP_045462949.1 leucine-rich repeat-containing protein let-4-like [Harmonia axyridis]
MNSLQTKWFLMFVILKYINCVENDECTVKRTSDRRRICEYNCRYVDFGFENVTCKNLDQMHATANLCSKKCTLTFLGNNNDILRTNSFSLLEKLERVFLNSTGIKTIQSRAFSGSSTIKLVNLADNKISRIPKDTFSQLQNLTFLDLSNNNIEDIEEESFSGCVSLTYIDLSNNSLKKLSSSKFESLLYLQTLNLSRNSLESMDSNWCHHFHSLKNLILDHNRISTVENCTSNFNIDVLSFSNNNITILNGPLFPIKLRKLNLSGNLMKVLKNRPFQLLKNLEFLDISKNKLDNLPFELFVNLKKLSYLDVSFNNLVKINVGVFHGLVSLKFLNLADIETGAFFSTKNLTEIDISGNAITDLDAKTLFKFCSKLAFLNIDGNSFTCSDLSQIFVQAEEKKISIYPGSSYGGTNFLGISCNEDYHGSSNVSKSTNQLENFFENGFKLSSFYKFFESFKQPSRNDNRELIEIQKDFIRNISSAISKILNDFLVEEKKIRRTENTDIYLQKLLSHSREPR